MDIVLMWYICFYIFPLSLSLLLKLFFSNLKVITYKMWKIQKSIWIVLPINNIYIFSSSVSSLHILLKLLWHMYYIYKYIYSFYILIYKYIYSFLFINSCIIWSYKCSFDIFYCWHSSYFKFLLLLLYIILWCI